MEYAISIHSYQGVLGKSAKLKVLLHHLKSSSSLYPTQK